MHTDTENRTPLDGHAAPNDGHAAPAQAWVGLDVSKATLDACLLRAGGRPLARQFANAPAGFAALLRWARAHAPEGGAHFCLEATGPYGRAVASFLADAGERVSVVNPYRVRHAALSRGVGNKTDAADARVLADYCRTEDPPPWRAAAPEVRLLAALLRRVQALKGQLREESNRLGEPGVLQAVRRSLERSIRFLGREIAALEAAVRAHVEAHPRLREDRELLTSIPGIGAETAHWILAELPEVGRLGSAQAAAAFAGLAPQEHRSGTSVRRPTRLSKRGSRHLRRALYMPALAARRHNPPVRALFERLVGRGRPAAVAVGAAMRKLLMIAYGVLKSRQRFRAEFGAEALPAPA